MAEIALKLTFTGRGLACPACQHCKSRVIESRGAVGGYIRRRRRCFECDRRYTTYEQIAPSSPLKVIKRGGHRVAFNLRVILTGVIKACVRRPVSVTAMTELRDAVVRHVHRVYQHEVDSEQIGLLVLERLKNLDQVAAVRFASVFYRPKNAEDFLGIVNAFATEPAHAS